jgi:alpha/beta superfamily hydrolase
VEEPVLFEAASGVEIEGALAVGAGDGALVVCHPHPLYGGDMDNPVVIRAAEVAREVGLATLRFNFRGVGRSSGTHDDGRDEQNDVRAALAYLRSRVERGTPLGLAGYSFGASVAARVAERERDLSALCLIAPPIVMSAFERPTPSHLHLLVVAGTRDEYCPVPDLDALATRLPAGAVVQVDNADHFFSGKLFPLGEAIRAWARGWMRQ